MERMGLSMTKPDPIMIAVANFNNWYKKEIAKSKRKKLKNMKVPLYADDDQDIQNLMKNKKMNGKDGKRHD